MESKKLFIEKKQHLLLVNIEGNKFQARNFMDDPQAYYIQYWKSNHTNIWF